jgi:hypothetical protein
MVARSLEGCSVVLSLWVVAKIGWRCALGIADVARFARSVSLSPTRYKTDTCARVVAVKFYIDDSVLGSLQCRVVAAGGGEDWVAAKRPSGSTLRPEQRFRWVGPPVTRQM